MLERWLGRIFTKEVASAREIEISSATHIGSREYQQDQVYVSESSERSPGEMRRILATVCDGMGGMTDGGKASETAVMLQKERFEVIKDNPEADIPSFLDSVTQEANDIISRMPKENGRGSGTTMVSVVVENDRFWWAASGDSRIYLLHDGKLQMLTRDHNYDMILKHKLKKCEITPEEYLAQRRKEALVSFLGIGDMRIKDISKEPIQLYKNDMIMLCSDGISKTISDDEIAYILQEGRGDKAKVLVEAAINKNRIKQDNTSAVVIEYKNKPVIG